MSRLIDADALIERMRKYIDGDWHRNLGAVFTHGIEACIHFAEEARTIEAVPVVDRNEVITEVLEAVKDVYHNFGGYDLEHMTKYGNETEEQQHQSYSTMMMYEIASEFDDLIDRISMMLEV